MARARHPNRWCCNYCVPSGSIHSTSVRAGCHHHRPAWWQWIRSCGRLCSSQRTRKGQRGHVYNISGSWSSIHSMGLLTFGKPCQEILRIDEPLARRNFELFLLSAKVGKDWQRRGIICYAHNPNFHSAHILTVILAWFHGSEVQIWFRKLNMPGAYLSGINEKK